MDVKIKSNEEEFKMRVAGCLIVDVKMLVVRMCNNGFYCLPGGHVHLGESSKDAMLREFKEEVGLECKADKMFALIENFFTNNKGKKMHEVCYFYLIDPLEKIETKDYSCVENDEGELKKLEFRWVDLSELKTIDFRPVVLSKKLQNKSFDFEHIIYGD